MPAVIRDDIIKITFSFSYDMVSLVKQIPDRKWKPDLEGKPWHVPATPWHCRETIAVLNGHVQIGQDVKNMAKQDKDTNRYIGRERADLYDFQCAAVDFLHECKGKALIADEMGLGKTIMALTWMREQRVQRSLVVAPASVIYKWERECRRWYPEASVAVIPKTVSLLPNTHIHIMSYDIMRRKVDELVPWSYDLVLFDEFHKLARYKSLRVRAARKVARRRRYIIGLSGTPLLNRPIELFSILRMVDPKGLGSWMSYADRYCYDPHEGNYQGARNLPELKERLRAIMIRRLKTEVLEELPDLTRTILPVNINPSLYNKVYSGHEPTILDNFNPEIAWHEPIVMINMLRQIIGWEKTKTAIQLAKEHLATTNGKLVLYIVHKANLSTISDELECEITWITGDVPGYVRAQRIDRWQTEREPRVMVITKAGGEGIDLFGKDGVVCDRIIFIEREWGPAPESQAESRLHRIGQENAVEAVYLVAKHTIDEDINWLIESKRSILRDAIGIDEVPTIEKELLDLFLGRR